ncbi:MAG TPA: nuclear transport factor 2 family protein [Acidisarcina sp.]
MISCSPSAVRRIALFFLLEIFTLVSQPALRGQLPLTLPPRPDSTATALSGPGLPAGTAFLFQLEANAVKATAEGGGKAFADLFSADAVSLSNGKAAVVGHEAIARGATWEPGKYKLTWTPVAGQMAPSGDMGFDWGHYEASYTDANGKVITEKGRYMTVWKKQSDGLWKIAMDSSNTEPPDSADCCRVL